MKTPDGINIYSYWYINYNLEIHTHKLRRTSKKKMTSPKIPKPLVTISKDTKMAKMPGKELKHLAL